MIDVNKNLKDTTIFVMSFIFGFIIHLYPLTHLIFNNDYIEHNFIFNTGFGAGSISGRWGIELFNYLFNQFGYNIKVPAFSVLLAIIFLSISNVFLLKTIKIENNILKFIAIFSSMVSPALVDTMYFPQAVHIYSFSILLITFGCYLIEIKDIRLLGGFCLIFAISIYQAYISYMIALFLLYYIQISLDEPILVVVKKILRDAILVILCFLIYLYIHKIVNVSLYDGYVFQMHGMENGELMQNYTAEKIIDCIKQAYKYFFSLASDENVFFFNNTLYVKKLWLVCFTIAFFALLCITKKILTLILVSFLPLFINFIFIMTVGNIELSEARVVYSYVLVFVFFTFIVDRVSSFSLFKKIIGIIFISIVSLLLIDESVLASRSYFYSDRAIDVTRGYAFELSEKIKEKQNGDDVKIVFIGIPLRDSFMEENYDPIKNNYVPTTSFGSINLFYSSGYPFNLLNYFTGENYKIPDADDEYAYYLKWSKLANEMPIYPSDGSILRQDNIILVKFSNTI